MKKTMAVRVMAIVGALGAMSTLASAQQIAGAQGFNVVLVLGDLDGATAPADNVPVAANKALADMKDFLPYKSYRLLDTAWILGANAQTTATSRLRGVDERDYELTLSASPEPAGAVSNRLLRMSVQLREWGAVREASSTPSLDHIREELARQAERRSPAQREAAAWATNSVELEKQRAVVESEVRALRGRYGERHPQVVGRMAELDRLAAQLRATQRSAADASTAIARERADVESRFLELKGLDARTRVLVEARKIIDTGFTMSVGETVVVGTSRVGGDKAIIALLTAVPRAKK